MSTALFVGVQVADLALIPGAESEHDKMGFLKANHGRFPSGWYTRKHWLDDAYYIDANPGFKDYMRKMAANIRPQNSQLERLIFSFPPADCTPRLHKVKIDGGIEAQHASDLFRLLFKFTGSSVSGYSVADKNRHKAVAPKMSETMQRIAHSWNCRDRECSKKTDDLQRPNHILGDRQNNSPADEAEAEAEMTTETIQCVVSNSSHGDDEHSRWPSLADGANAAKMTQVYKGTSSFGEREPFHPAKAFTRLNNWDPESLFEGLPLQSDGRFDVWSAAHQFDQAYALTRGNLAEAYGQISELRYITSEAATRHHKHPELVKTIYGRLTSEMLDVFARRCIEEKAGDDAEKATMEIRRRLLHLHLMRRMVAGLVKVREVSASSGYPMERLGSGKFSIVESNPDPVAHAGTNSIPDDATVLADMLERLAIDSRAVLKGVRRELAVGEGLIVLGSRLCLVGYVEDGLALRKQGLKIVADAPKLDSTQLQDIKLLPNDPDNDIQSKIGAIFCTPQRGFPRHIIYTDRDSSDSFTFGYRNRCWESNLSICEIAGENPSEILMSARVRANDDIIDDRDGAGRRLLALNLVPVISMSSAKFLKNGRTPRLQ